MHWNHRVIKYSLPDGEVIYAVREVFYDEHDDGSNKAYAYVDDPEGVQAEDLDGLRRYVEWMLKALDQPCLAPADFGLSEADALAKWSSSDRLENYKPADGEKASA